MFFNMFNCLKKNEINNLHYNTTPFFSLKNKKKICKVLDVYDGDTITIGFNLKGFGIIKLKCRLLGIDTPEMKGSSDENKKKAIDARNYLIKEVSNIVIDSNNNNTRNEIKNLLGNSKKTINCLFDDMDKYGRILITVYDDDGNDINTKLINNGYAKKYDGGKKI